MKGIGCNWKKGRQLNTIMFNKWNLEAFCYNIIWFNNFLQGTNCYLKEMFRIGIKGIQNFVQNCYNSQSFLHPYLY